MSKFYQALERAEQERISQHQGQSEEVVRLDQPSAPPSILSPPRRAIRNNGPISSLPTDTIEAHLVSLIAPETFEAEQYRTLSYTIDQLHADAGLTVIAITSPTAGDGKTTTAINLASTLTQLPGARVLLVDLDIRRPCVAINLGMSQVKNRGLVDFVQDPSIALEDVLQPYHSSKLTILLTGQVPSTPYDILQSARIEELVTEVRQHYDYIVLDTPPLLPFPDCRLIERFVDGFLVVVGAHKTPRKLVTEGISVIDPEKIVGVVFNSDDQPVFGDYSYYSHDTYRPIGAVETRKSRWFKKKFTTLFHRDPRE